MYYFSQSDGDVIRLLKSYLVNNVALKPKEFVRRRSDSGIYALFEAHGKAYLSTCVNAQGPTTVTREQFLANRTTYDLKPDRLLPILIGQANIRDSRCLWINLSMPVQAGGVRGHLPETSRRLADRVDRMVRYLSVLLIQVL